MIFRKIFDMAPVGEISCRRLSSEISDWLTRAYSDESARVPTRARTAEGGAGVSGRVAGGGRTW